MVIIDLLFWIVSCYALFYLIRMYFKKKPKDENNKKNVLNEHFNENEDDCSLTIEDQEFWDNFGKWTFIIGGIMCLILYLLDRFNLLNI